MRFTNNPYEGFMKEKSYFKGVRRRQNNKSGRLPHTGWDAGHCETGRGLCPAG